MEKLIPAIPIACGYLLDLWLADPEKWPHPVRWFGSAIAWGDQWLNRGSYRFIKGALLTLIYTSSLFISLWLMDQWLWQYSWIAWMFLNILGLWWGIANQALIDAAKAVFQKLNEGIAQGRQQVGLIVGRDTHNLTEQQVKIATLETMAENLSDGVIAPLFYYGLLGLPGIMTYKLINTCDSMLGYRNPRYEYFGKFPAKLDDLINYIPARITVLLLWMASLNGQAIRYAIRDGHKHKSPNAGYPEAAVAGILRCRFGGPNFYDGQLVEKPYIGDQEKQIEYDDFRKAARLNHGATLWAILLVMIGRTLCLW